MKNLLWNYGQEGYKLSGTLAVVGTFLTSVLGGWDKPLQLLIGLMVFDFFFGILAALKEKTLDSKVMFWGGLNKIIVIMVVVLGHFSDLAFGLDDPIFRTAFIYFYCGREGLSVVENCGKLGLPIPQFFAKFLEQLKDKGDKGGEE